MISLAKRIEEVFTPNNSIPILLKPNSVELKLLQRIRDEAHRFATNFHRNLRTTSQTSSTLEEIKGLGKKKIQELLKVFGSSENISKASVEELNLVKGINKSLAINVFNYFNKKNRIKSFFLLIFIKFLKIIFLPHFFRTNKYF